MILLLLLLNENRPNLSLQNPKHKTKHILEIDNE